VEFAEEHDLKIISIADIIQYRLRTEGLVHCVKHGDLTLPSGQVWSAHVYQVRGDGRQFLALRLGDISDEPTLVRVHTGSVAGDVFGASLHPRVRVSDAVKRIEAEGNGVILFLPGRVDLERDLAFYLGESPAPPTTPPDEGEVLREYGLGAQVLRHLGLSKIRVLTNRPRRIPSLQAYGLSVVEQLLLDAEGVAPSVQSDIHTVTH
jgi:3,4-dihydroxy 2-butanone 4-phosphate synthase/GTP cyclohydrolase II